MDMTHSTVVSIIKHGDKEDKEDKDSQVDHNI
jgi:hypothetical protein